MSVLQFGIPIVTGVPSEIRPIIGAPEGRQRLKFRNNGAARLFVKTPDGIRHFVISKKGDDWFCDPSLEQGRNLRR